MGVTFRARVRAWFRGTLTRRAYRPERNYMRGPGEACIRTQKM